MDILDCISTRRSIRRFADLPVEFEKIGNILNAARDAPSAGNLQDWKFILITDKEKIEKISKACFEQYWIANAPICFVACVEPAKTKRYYGDKGDTYSIMNGAAAVQNMLLATHQQGLASCWVAAFEETILKRELGIPDDITIIAVLPVGYPDEQVPKPTRFTIEDVTFIENWGNKIKDLAEFMQDYGEHVQKAVKKGKKLIENFARRLQQ
jgi:nitroreductase